MFTHFGQLPAPVVTWRGDPPVDIGEVMLRVSQGIKGNRLSQPRPRLSETEGGGEIVRGLHASLCQPPMSSGVFTLVKCWVYQRDLVMLWKQMALRSRCPKAVVLISSSHHTCPLCVNCRFCVVPTSLQHLSWQSRHHLSVRGKENGGCLLTGSSDSPLEITRALSFHISLASCHMALPNYYKDHASYSPTVPRSQNWKRLADSTKN